MSKYELMMPQYLALINKYYVGVRLYGSLTSLYLRPSGELLESTGAIPNGGNVGYWDTYEEALEAKQQYEKIANNPIWLSQNKDTK